MTEERTGEKILDYIFNQLDLKTIIDTSIMNSLTKESKDKLVGEIVSYLYELCDCDFESNNGSNCPYCNKFSKLITRVK